jgi:hypothetical protein
VKYFLSLFDKVYFAIPSECTERIISATRAQSSVCETEEQDVFISLPLLFRRADLPASHGLVLKQKDGKKKITLVVPPLDIDIEIPKEDIYGIPRVFSKKMPHCNGMCFVNRDKEERLIFTLDIEKLAEEYS